MTLYPGAPSPENRLLCLITFLCMVADSRSRRYPIGRTVCIGKSLNGRADRAHIRCANPQRPERSFQAPPLLSLAEVAACFRRTLEAEAPVHDEDVATEASPSTSRSPTVQAAVPNSLTSRSIYFPESEVSVHGQSGGSPPHLLRCSVSRLRVGALDRAAMSACRNWKPCLRLA